MVLPPPVAAEWVAEVAVARLADSREADTKAAERMVGTVVGMVAVLVAVDSMVEPRAGAEKAAIGEGLVAARGEAAGGRPGDLAILGVQAVTLAVAEPVEESEGASEELTGQGAKQEASGSQILLLRSRSLLGKGCTSSRPHEVKDSRADRAVAARRPLGNCGQPSTEDTPAHSGWASTCRDRT